ncbi:oligoendopeptidase F [Halapricum sp. CBA1109]|uniref:oligoendopeptidase F n=1 Tax=Halapricum sp. CBA1109 TaxID=2668068 RepID=UPI0012F8AE2D|nr:oligoendopeptidase F [Halapricum sp. CBA1109]MUV90118.1 oligoendopeptidase F [Halapricum sp. CBA1109]
MSSVPEREDVDTEYTWDLESLYASDDDWEAAFERAQELTADLGAYEGQATDDAETLLETLETYEELMRTVSNVGSYARMRRDEDTREDTYQALLARAQSLSSEASSAASFLEPELQALDRADIDSMADAEPELAVYDHYFDDVLRMADHTRSAEVEEVLAELGEVTGAPGEVYNMLANADMEFPTVEDPDGDAVEITLNNFTTLQQRQDRQFRQDVYEAFYDEWETVRNAVGTAYKNAVKTDEKTALIRDYDSAREMAMDGPNVPVEVYDTLLETVRNNLDNLHRHAELKHEVVGGDELRMWDLYVPLTETESPDIEYEQACEYIVDAVAPLGEDYQSRVAEGLESRWVDVYETRGKQSGAYSGGTYDSQPYILMNYQDDVESMYTLAHELGHSLHSEYTSEEQPYVYSDYEIFVAEVASTVNETLLTHHLLDTVEDDRLRRHILNQYLERFRSTLYRQTMFAEFEHRAHEQSAAGEPLTPDRLDDLYADLKGDYYEPAVLDDRIAREWMRIPHFYRSFYVYQYATGISAAVALVEGIMDDDDPGAADRYVDFLSRGSAAYPLELLDDAGVDMTDAATVESALDVYADYLDEMESLV